jgi:glutathionylspermidine synthase
MRRIEIPPRPDWAKRCEALGFDFHSSGPPYWNEGAVYEFTVKDVERIEAAAVELHRLCLLAIEHVIAQELLPRIGVVFKEYQQWVAHSWRRREPALLGRFDLAYDGSGEPKLLEYNADTPTSLLETAVVQWHWLEEVRRPEWEQFNSAHGQIIARWREILPEKAFIHFICQTESTEDVAHVRYLLDTVKQADRNGVVIDISDVGVDPDRELFIDRLERPIEHAFKLYPWEWMLTDRFGPELPSRRTRFIEPPWRTVLNSKGLLPVLWELFPNHPNLLPAYWSPKPLKGAPHVSKPTQSREGANITVVGVNGGYSTSGPYGGIRIYQAYTPLFNSDRRHAVVGAWMVGDNAAGLSVREDATLITGGGSQFVPHVYR